MISSNSSTSSNFSDFPLNSQESKTFFLVNRHHQTPISVFNHCNEIIELISQYFHLFEFSLFAQLSKRIGKISKFPQARKFSTFFHLHETSQCYLNFINLKEKCYLRCIDWHIYSRYKILPNCSLSGILPIGEFQFHEICPLLESMKLIVWPYSCIESPEVTSAYRRCLNSLSQCKN